MSTTARQIITRGLKKLGVVGQGQTVGANDADDALAILNDMIDAWKADMTTVYAITRQVFNLTSGQAIYTLGVGGDFNTDRPDFNSNIEPRISIITQTAAAYPLELPLDVLDIRQWQSTPVKNVPSALPTRAYVTKSFPLAQIQYWPKPNVAALQTALYLPTVISEFATLDTPYDLPPAYRRAITYNFCIDAAPDFAASLGEGDGPIILGRAAEYLNDIRRANTRPETVPCDPAVVRGGKRFNYYTGEVK